MFSEGKIKRLSAIKSLNEGVNIPMIDIAVIGQVSSEEKEFIQRLGRILRLRDGHVGDMYVVAVKGTQDEIWLKEALSSFDESEINYFTFEEFQKVWKSTEKLKIQSPNPLLQTNLQH